MRKNFGSLSEMPESDSSGKRCSSLPDKVVQLRTVLYFWNRDLETQELPSQALKLPDSYLQNMFIELTFS